MKPDKNFYYFGKVVKPLGLKGEVTIYMDVDQPEEYTELNAVFLNIRGKLVPFTIDKLNLKNGNQAGVKFSEINSEDQLQNIIGSEMYLPVELLPKLSGNKFYYHEVIGFEVIDSHHGNIGSIKEVFDYPNQDVFSVVKDYKEILIPVSDEVIKHVNRKEKIIEITAPDGLIDIYLE